MALRFLIFSSPATCFSAEAQQAPFKPLSPHCHGFSLSRSLPLLSPLSLSLSARTRRSRDLQTHFSSPAVESPPESPADPAPEERSTTRLYAQNVPWDSTPEDVRAIFEKYGTVEDVELSMYNRTRNRGLAFVSMSTPEEAAEALNNLQSYELNGRVLRLDYARARTKKITPPPEPKPEITFNLFVANLSYEARAKDLKEFFKAEGHNAVSAEIIFHDNPRRSLGYGFVAFKSKKEADAALAVADKICVGRPIRVARSKQFVKEPKPENVESEDTVESSSDSKQESEVEAKAESEVQAEPEAVVEAADGN